MERMHQNRTDIIAGGTIDFKHSIINPTVIVRGIERYPNYQEIYGAITFIHPYKKTRSSSFLREFWPIFG